MANKTLRNLEKYKHRRGLSDRALARELEVPPVYIFRWRKAGRIIGAYQRIIEDFLAKESREQDRHAE